MYVTYLMAKMAIHPAQKAQMASLLAEEVNVLKKYIDFSDVFSKKSAAVLLERSDINEHAIDLESGK